MIGSGAGARGIRGRSGTEESMSRRATGWAGRLVATMFVVLVAGGAGIEAQTATPVSKLDMERFTGTWYEMARYPNKDEKRCVSDVMEVIAQGAKANRMDIVRTCHNKDRYTDVKNIRAKAANKSGDGQLKTGLIWPLTSKYWVLALGPQYEWALAGTPNHKSLWVLSRLSRMRPEVLAEIKGMAVAQGFAPEKLVATSQVRQRDAVEVLGAPAAAPASARP